MIFTPEKDYVKYLARGSGIVFVVSIFLALTGLGLRMILARTLTIEDYGLFYAIIAFITLFGTFCHLGLNNAIVKFLSEFRAKEKWNALKSTLLTGLTVELILTITISTILIVFSSKLALGFFNAPQAGTIIIIVVAWFFLKMLSTFLKSVFHGFQDMLGRSIAGDSWIFIVFPLVLVFTLFFTLDLTTIALLYVLGTTVAITLSFILLRKRHSHLLSGGASVTKSTAKKMFAFGLPLVLAGVSGMIVSRTDTLMITWFRSLKDVGLYQVARPVASFLMYVGTAISAPLFPMISELWAEGKSKTLNLTLYFLAKFSIIFIIPAALVFLAFPDIAIRLLFGARYLGAVMALRALAVGMIFFVGSSILIATLAGIGKSAHVAKAWGIAAAFNFFTNLLLVPPYGAGGAAIATSLSFLLLLLLCFRYLQRFIKFPIPALSILKALVGGGLTLFLIFILKSITPLPAWPTFFIVLISALVAYILWILRTGTLTRSDIRMLSRTVPVPDQIIRVMKRLLKE